MYDIIATNRLKLLSNVSQDLHVHLSDAIMANAYANIAKILFSPLSDKQCRLYPTQFISWARFYLRLPQLPRLSNGRLHEDTDYEMEECMSHHSTGKDRRMDLFGNHANSGCPSCSFLGLTSKTQLLQESSILRGTKCWMLAGYGTQYSQHTLK